MKIRAILKTGAALPLILWAAQGHAQEAAPADSAQQAASEASEASEYGDIIVTATRREQTLQDTPLSVNVATGEQLEKLSILDTKDIGRLAPGLELTNTTGRSNTITLRGIGFDPDQGTGPAVQTYLNEIPTSAQTLFTALYDVGQIEVLRGAQGLLRGLSAPAGAITITTRRPDFDRITGYAGAEHYVDTAKAVTDGKVVSASGLAPVTFAAAVARLVAPEAEEMIVGYEAMFAREFSAG